MRRRALIARSQRQLQLARLVASRWPLVRRGKRYQQLAQALGAEATDTVGDSATTAWEQGMVQPQKISYIEPLHIPMRESVEVQSSEIVEDDEEEQGEDKHERPFFLQRQAEISELSVPNMETPLEILVRETARVDQQPEKSPEATVQEAVDTGKQTEQMITQSQEALAEPVIMRPQEALAESVIMQSQESFPEQVAGVGTATSIPEPENPYMVTEQRQKSSAANALLASKGGQPKRQQKRIQEQPARTIQAKPVSPIKKGASEDIRQTVRFPKADTQGQKEVSVEVPGTAKDLFVPGGTERSPQEWLALLVGQQSVSPSVDAAREAIASRGDVSIGTNISKKSRDKQLVTRHEQSMRNEYMVANRLPATGDPVGGRDSPQPRVVTPLSLHTVRFLRPLLGIDPTSAEVYRDVFAEHLTDHYQADAITVGNQIELAAERKDDTPETLGLLAHELTHVARRREPHFIPPVVASSHTTGPTVTNDAEEALALRVEAQVTGIAREQSKQGESVSLVPVQVGPHASRPVVAPNAPSALHLQRNAWGGLPAPWEPLPPWLAPAPTSTNVEKNRQVSASSPPSFQADQRMAEGQYSAGGTEYRETWSGSGSVNSGIQRAGRERSLSIEEEASRSDVSPLNVKAPEPDLDALAQQVYIRLKRRLGVEHRRES
jgi:Domain of unknown function (DUF4157)